MKRKYSKRPARYASRKEARQHRLYLRAKNHAWGRKILFEFTYEDWILWWEEQLGPNWMKKKGRRSNQYCMARFGDKGNYSRENVKCITNTENHVERNQSPAFRSKISKSLMGNTRRLGMPHTLKARHKISRSLIGNLNTLNHILSYEHRAKISTGLKKAWQEGKFG